MASSILKARVELNTTSVEHGLKKMRKGFNNIAAIGAGAAIAAVGAGIAYSVKKSTDFEKSLTKVWTLLDGVTKTDMQKIGKQVQELAVKYGIPAAEAMESLYQTISAGQKPAQALETLNSVAMLAKGGFVEMSQATMAVTKLMNIYGKEAGGAARVSDLLFQTVKLGQTDMEKLSGSVGSFMGLSKELGLSMEESLGIFAQLTTTMGSTEKSATAIRAVFNSILKPSDKLSVILKRIAREQGSLKDIGLVNTLQALKNEAGGSAEKFAKMFTSQEALNGALQLTGDNAQRSQEKIAQMNNALGASSGAYQKVEKTAVNSFEVVKEQLDKLARSAGDELLPEVTSALNLLNGSLQELEKTGELAEFSKNIGGGLKELINLTTKLIPLVNKAHKSLADMLLDSSIVLAKTAYSKQWQARYGELKMDEAGNISLPGMSKEEVTLERIARATERTEQKLPEEAI